MTTTDVIVIAFSVCNSLRLFAYLPQLVSVLRDGDGARGVSLLTWTLFTVANGSTTAYAFAIVGDMRMTMLFAFNTLFSLAIAFGTFAKRRATRKRSVGAPRLSSVAGSASGG